VQIIRERRGQPEANRWQDEIDTTLNSDYAMKPQAQKNNLVKNSNGNFYLGGQLKSNFEFGSFSGGKKLRRSIF